MGIEGKVAKILNSREIVINKGLEDGVKTGMKFNVQEQETTIIDPDSKADLGQLMRPKISVEVMHVDSKFSVARTFDTYQTLNPDAIYLSSAFSRYITRVKKIRTQSDFEYREDSASVSVGDTVVEITK